MSSYYPPPRSALVNMHSMAEVVKMLQAARTSPNWQKFDKVERDRYSSLCGCFSFS